MPNLRFFDLRVIDGDVCPFQKEIADQRNSGRFASVTSVCLECEAQHSNVLQKRMNRKTGIRNNTDTYNNEMNLTRSSCKYEGKTNLAGNSVEQGVNHGLGESALLVLVHLDHLSPVGGDLGQV